MLDKVYEYPLKECARPCCKEMVPRESASGKIRSKRIYDLRQYHSHSCSQLHTADKHREKLELAQRAVDIQNRFLSQKL